ncbi:MAG: ROK family protein, partial [Spirochaetales bacterium]|nr:ROK family protein [Spirochaetales bacterium]
GIVARCKTRTVGGDNESVYRQIVETIQCALDKAEIGRDGLEAVGIAVPGPIDLDRGVVLDTPNVGISNFPLVDRLSGELGCAVLLENDVNAGLWGEYVAGAAKGMRNVVGIFPGTGIGGGLILDGKLYRGKSGAAGEIGHITVQTDGRRCGCGNHGCLETVASKTAIARDLVLLAMNGQSKVLAEAGATDIRLIKSGLIAKALEAGEPAVAAVVAQAARFLGVGMAAMVNTFDPEMVVIGGGLVEKVGSHITDIAVSTMRERAMPRIVADVAVATAALGDDAVVVGAADLTRR